jgi:hypothetical protein
LRFKAQIQQRWTPYLVVAIRTRGISSTTVTPVPVTSAVLKMAEAAMIVIVPPWYEHTATERGGEN